MASPVKLYQKEMHDNMGFFATWLPGDSIELGDIGILQDGRFRKVTSLKEIGIEFSVNVGQSKQNVQYTSSKGVSISTSGGVKKTSILEGEIKFEFAQEGAFIFNANGLTDQTINDLGFVTSQIIKVFNERKWDKTWLLIESIHTADNLTIVVSQDSSSALTLKANTKIPISFVSLNEPKIKFTVSATKGKIIHVTGGKKLHPLYSCLRLKESFFMGDISLQPVRGSSFSSRESPFLIPSIDELINS